MFKRLGTVEVLEILDFKKVASLKDRWQDIVRSSFDSPVSLDLELDPENFLIFRCRSISSCEKYGPNGNGDAFPWRELKAAYKTFIGRGFYIEHDSDDWKKSKGIIINATLNEDEQYVECIVAVDKRKYPEIVAKLQSGEINAVSMGCNVDNAECMVCGNMAKNEMDLCAHMNPNSSQYCKGMKNAMGKIIGEINRGLCFTELSGVKMPADANAQIKMVLSKLQGDDKMDETIMNKLTAREYELLRTALKQEGSNVNVDDIVKRVADEVERRIKPSDAIKDKVEKDKEDTKIDVKEEKKEETEKKNPEDVELEKVSKTEVEDDKTKEMKEKETKEKEKELKKDEKKEKKEEKKEEKEKEKPKEKEDKKEKETKDEIALGDGFVLKPETVKDIKLLRLYDRDKATKMFTEMITEDLSEIEKVNKYRENLKLSKEKVKASEIDASNLKEGGKSMLEITYKIGNTLDNSYFVGKEGDKVRVVRASLVIPMGIQRQIVAAYKLGKEPEGVLEPLEVIAEMMKDCGGTMEGFENWIKANAKPFRKRASWSNWSINEGEIVKPELPKSGEIFRSMSEKEISSTEPKDVLRSDGTEVKKYFQRFPNSTVAEPERAINLRSKLLKQNEDQAKKIKELEAALESEKKDKENIKATTEAKAKAEDVNRIIAIATALGMVDETKPETKEEMVKKLSSLDAVSIGVVENMLKKVESKRTEAGAGGNDIPPHMRMGGSIPQSYETEVKPSGDLNNLIDIWTSQTNNETPML